MALAAGTNWEVEVGGSDSANGGGFNPNNANFAADGAVDVATANTAAPVFSSASYTFVAGDVGHWVFIKAGTSSTPGWYQIASVAASKATLSAAIGAGVKFVGLVPAGPTTLLGCGTTAAALSSLTWSVDYSQTTAPRYSYTDLSAGGAGAIVASSAKAFGKNTVGNLLQVTGTGGGFLTLGFYEIISISGANATLDRAVATGATATGAGGQGGALATYAKALSLAVGSNQIQMKGGAYSQASNPTVNPASVSPDVGVPPTTISGYVTVRGDATQANRASWPVITAATGCTTLIPLTTNGWTIQGLVLDCNAPANTTAATVGISTSGTYLAVRSTWVKNFKLSGIALNGGRNVVENCEISGGTAAATGGIVVVASMFADIRDCEIHGNLCPGVVGDSQVRVIDSLIYSNTGASSDGIQVGYNSVLLGNRIYANGRDGIRFTVGVSYVAMVHANILTNNGGYGLNNSPGDLVRADVSWDGNAYYNNTSGARNNVGTGTTDIIMTADPYTSASTGNFTINNAGGAGALIRAATYTYPSGTTVNRVAVGGLVPTPLPGGRPSRFPQVQV